MKVMRNDNLQINIMSDVYSNALAQKALNCHVIRQIHFANRLIVLELDCFQILCSILIVGELDHFQIICSIMIIGALDCFQIICSESSKFRYYYSISYSYHLTGTRFTSSDWHTGMTLGMIAAWGSDLWWSTKFACRKHTFHGASNHSAAV